MYKNAIFKNSKEEIILFGAGFSGEKCLEKFEKLGAKVLTFCGNNCSRQGGFLKGYPIISPEDLVDRREANVIITSTYEGEILEQLKQMGIRKIYIYS